MSRKLAPNLTKSDAELLVRSLLRPNQIQAAVAVDAPSSSKSRSQENGVSGSPDSKKGRRMVGMLLRATSDWETALQLEKFKSRHVLAIEMRDSVREAALSLSRATLRSDWLDRAHCLRLALSAGRPLKELEAWSMWPMSCRAHHVSHDGSGSFLLTRREASREYRLFVKCMRNLKDHRDVDTMLNALSILSAGAPSTSCVSSFGMLTGLGEEVYRKLTAKLLVTSASMVEQSHRSFEPRMQVLAAAQLYVKRYGRAPAGLLRHFRKLTFDCRPQKLQWFHDSIVRPSAVPPVEESSVCVLLNTMTRRTAKAALRTAGNQDDLSIRNRSILALLAKEYKLLTRSPQDVDLAKRVFSKPISHQEGSIYVDPQQFRLSCELLRHPRLIKRLGLRPLDVVATAFVCSPAVLSPRTASQAAAFVKILRHLDKTEQPMLVTWLTHRHLLRQKGMYPAPLSPTSPSPYSARVLRMALNEVLCSLKKLMLSKGDQACLQMASRCRILDLLEQVCEGHKRNHSTDVPYGDLALVAAASLDKGASFPRLKALLLDICKGDDSIIDYVRILSTVHSSTASASTSARRSEGAGAPLSPQQDERNPLLHNRRLLLALWHLESKHCGDNLVLLRLQCRLMVQLLREKYAAASDQQVLKHFSDALRSLATLHLCGAKFAVCLTACSELCEGGTGKYDRQLLESENCLSSLDGMMLQSSHLFKYPSK